GWIAVVGLLIVLVYAFLPSTRAARLAVGDEYFDDPLDLGYEDEYVIVTDLDEDDEYAEIDDDSKHEDDAELRDDGPAVTDSPSGSAPAVNRCTTTISMRQTSPTT
ncbi:hypothetical protein ACQR3S_22315, partial [Gordonia hongkongensis]